MTLIAACNGRAVVCAVAAVLSVSACYSAPSVSEPPTLDRAVLRLPKGGFTTESPLSQAEIPRRYDLQDSYTFYIDVTGKAGRFVNGDPEVEQWAFRTIDYTLTVGGQPMQVEWVADVDKFVMKSSFSLPGTDTGKTVELRATVSDALGRRSNEITFSAKLMAYTIDPQGQKVPVP